jgi:hypothetical protein
LIWIEAPAYGWQASSSPAEVARTQTLQKIKPKLIDSNILVFQKQNFVELKKHKVNNKKNRMQMSLLTIWQLYGQ